MPDQPDILPPPPSAARTASIQRARIVVHVAVQLLLLLFIFVVVNYLSCRRHRQWDLTDNQKFTLSTTTTHFLESLSQDVDVIVAFSASSAMFPDVKALIDEYARQSNGRMQVEYLDPIRNRSRAVDIREKYQLELAESGTKNRNALIVSSGENTQVILEKDMLLALPSAPGEAALTAFAGEEMLTSTLVGVVEKGARKFYLVYGHRRIDQLDRLKAEFDQLAALQNAEVTKLALAETVEIPEDCDALLVLGPTTDFNPEEMKALREYWDTRKGSLLFFLDPAAQTPNLFAFLREFGAPPRDDRILFAAAVAGGPMRKTYEVPAVFLPGSPVTRDLVGITTVLPGISQSLHVLPNDGLLAAQGITVKPLLVADKRFWGERNYEEEAVSRNEMEDNLTPLYLAAAVEKGAVDDPNLRVDTSRFVVLSNSVLFEESTRRNKVNVDFITASLNWLVDREELIGISPKQPSKYRITLAPKQFKRIQTLVLFIMPLAVFFFGIGVWAARRS